MGSPYTTSAITITVNASPSTPTITPTGSTTFCSGGSVTLTSSAASSYQWYNGGELIAALPTKVILLLLLAVIQLLLASGCASASSLSTIVTVNPLPGVSAIGGGQPTVCVNSTTAAFTDATPGGSWSITNGTGSANISPGGIVTGLTAGTVTVVYAVSNGTCFNTATKSLTVNSLPSTPTITPTGSTTLCSGGSVTLTSSAAASNQWYNGGVLISGATNQSYAATASGSYSIIVTNTAGCTSAASLSTNVTISDDPASVGGTVSSNQTTFCSGSTPADLVLDGNTGNVVKWQKSTFADFSSSVTDITNPVTTLAGTTIGALVTTTYF